MHGTILPTSTLLPASHKSGGLELKCKNTLHTFTVSASDYHPFSPRREESAMRREERLKPTHAFPLPLKRRGLRQARAS
jgi:hypothetical protein